MTCGEARHQVGSRSCGKEKYEVPPTNANQCSVAHDLIWRAAVSDGVDFVLITKPNTKVVASDGCNVDRLGDAAIKGTSDHIAVLGVTRVMV